MSFFSGGSLAGIVMWIFRSLLAVLVLLLSAVALLLGTEFGTARLLGWLPGVEVVEPRGALLDDFSALRVTVSLPRSSSVRIDALRWSGWAWDWDWRLAGGLVVGLDRLSAREVRVHWVSDPEAPDTAMAWPTTLTLPVAASIATVQVGQIHVNLLGPKPLQDLDLSLALQSLDDAGRAAHVLDLRKLGWHQALLSGQVRVADRGDMSLTSRWRARLHSAGQADLSLQGPLQDLTARLSVDVASGGGQAAQHLSATARIQSRSVWPLTSLQVDAKGFDLQAVHPELPMTALSGTLNLWPRMPDLQIEARLVNGRAGSWDQGRIPVLDVDLDLTLPAQASVKALGELGRHGSGRLLAHLPSRQARASGTVSLSGPWDLARLDQTALRARLDGVDLRALHGAAPALMLGGDASVQGQSDGAWAVTAALQGREAGDVRIGQPVNADLQGRWWRDTFELQRLQLLSAGARAEASGRWTLQSAGWRATAAMRLEDFDPAVWLPWPRPAGDAAQATRLRAQVNLDMNRAGDWSRTTATVQAQVSDSLLLGVPTQARLQWSLQPAAAAVTLRGSTASLELVAGGHAVSADVRWPSSQLPGSPGAVTPGSQVKARASLRRMADLEPWARAFGLRHLQGALEGDLLWRGNSETAWSSQGRIDVRGLRWDDDRASGGVDVGHAQASWDAALGLGASQPWKVDASIDRASWKGGAVQEVVARLEGTFRAHRLGLQGRAKVSPPAGSQAEPLQADVGLQVDGQWSDPGRGPWRGTVRSLKVAPPGAVDGSEWLLARDVTLGVVPPARAGWQVEAAGSSLQVLGASLDLRKARWQQGGDAAAGQSELDVRLLPWRVVRTLQHLQPRAGWGGDLTVDGQLSLQQVAGRPWVVDGSLRRASGDLNFSDLEVKGGTPQRLGIRELGIELQARDGLWRAKQTLQARLIGSITGEQQVRPASPDALPGADALLQGRLEAEVSNLRTLAAWLPPGWRLSGLLQARTQIAGTLGAPLFNGEVTGSDIGVSNGLEGVNVSGGAFLARLAGDRMTLERFTADGGSGGGTLSLSGEAVFDQSPTVQLVLDLQRFAALQRVDRRVRVSGRSELRIDPARLSMRGQFRIDEGLIDIGRSTAPTIGEDVMVVNRPGQPANQIARSDEGPRRKKTPSGREVDVDVRVDLGDELRLFGMGLDTRLAGTLRATTPAGRLQVTGSIATVGGTFAAYGQKLSITRGRVIFTGLMDNPRLDIEATRPRSPMASAQDVTVGVTITGTASDPRVRLFSEPPMSETDKLSWLVLGRDSAGLGGADLLLLQTAASALLGSDANPAASLAQTFGLDELSVRQSDAGTGETVVTLGRRISDRWYMGFEQSVNGAETRWQLIYRLAQRITLRIQTGEDTTVDLIWQLLWD